METSKVENFPIHEVRYDEAVYPFINVVYGHCETTVDDSVSWVYAANIFASIIGKGQSPQEAKQNWEQMFHQTFQEIYTKLDWERDEEEQQLWKTFERVVDIPAFRKLTPLKFGQTGNINRYISNDQCEIEWIGDPRDIINRDNCPSELFEYEIGKYFRANVLREYGTDNLVKICSISVSKYREYTREELDKIIDSLPTTKDFPVGVL
jgi:hypothetical protein